MNPGLVTLILVLAVFAMAVPISFQAYSPSQHPAPRSTSPSSPSTRISPDVITLSNTYNVPLTAIKNSTANTATISSAVAWTVLGNGFAESLFGFTGDQYAWNGTENFLAGVQIEFQMGYSQYLAGPTGGKLPYCATNLGILWANLSIGSSTYSTQITYNSVLSIQSTCPVTSYYAYAAFQFHLPAPAVGNPGQPLLLLTASPDPGYHFSSAGPVGARSVVVTGGGSTTALQTSEGVAGNFNLNWGWHWHDSSAVTSLFSSLGALATSPTLTWTSPYDVNVTYNSMTDSVTTSGSFSLASPSTVTFQPGRADPSGTYSFTAQYTISGTLNAQFLITYNYTQPGIGKKTTTYAATEVSAWNATWDEYTYTIPTPYTNLSRIWDVGQTNWLFLSAWPSGYTYTSANATVTWGKPCPNATQVVFIAPLQYGPAQLSIVYVPTSPIFSLFGAALPYSAVVTYVDGTYAPYSTIPVNLGQKHSIQTYDIFDHLLASTSIWVNQSAVVDSITLNIWPMSIVNLNSSYVVALNIQNYGVTQIAPDLMPLQSYVFYLPQGVYNFTIQYLAFGGGAVGSPTTFILNISGVSYDVVNGLTFLSVIASEQSIGSNLTKVITGVNVTILSTTASIENLINSFTSGLFSYHLVTGTATRTAVSFSIPITVTTGTGAVANISATRQMAQSLGPNVRERDRDIRDSGLRLRSDCRAVHALLHPDELGDCRTQGRNLGYADHRYGDLRYDRCDRDRGHRQLGHLECHWSRSAGEPALPGRLSESLQLILQLVERVHEGDGDMDERLQPDVHR